MFVFSLPQLNFMVKQQEALLLLLDVGPSMHPALSEIEKVCSMLVQKKVLVIAILLSIQSFIFFFFFFVLIFCYFNLVCLVSLVSLVDSFHNMILLFWFCFCFMCS